jgi:hypothetical protein
MLTVWFLGVLVGEKGRRGGQWRGKRYSFLERILGPVDLTQCFRKKVRKSEIRLRKSLFGWQTQLLTEEKVDTVGKRSEAATSAEQDKQKE